MYSPYMYIVQPVYSHVQSVYVQSTICIFTCTVRICTKYNLYIHMYSPYMYIVQPVYSHVQSVYVHSTTCIFTCTVRICTKYNLYIHLYFFSKLRKRLIDWKRGQPPSYSLKNWKILSMIPPG